MRKLATALTVCLFVTLPGAAAIKKKSATCPSTLTNCPSDGCSTDHDVDGGLNQQKNTTPGDLIAQGSATPMSLRDIKDLPDPENYSMGDPRDELTALGEGTKIRVVAYLLRAKPEGAESCNCGLTGVANTDNHLVLVSRFTLSKFKDSAGTEAEVFKAREEESITAEFTPRVRADGHPNFKRAKITPLIDAAPHKALRVRVTGMLTFDSEHFLHNTLVRVNDWEIHPILKLEYCDDDSCPVNGNTGWKSLDDL